ncbi:MAG: alpha/beta hydrolase [Thermoleophilia bacterium]|nr:alpha/beta hydrolase [Thermoleophilia bacterium]
MAMWHAVAPVLAEHFTVVCADLRGYGASGRPLSGEDHAGYSKRAMACDQVEVMEALGFDRFAVAGHDRGGRVARRMALDHPDRVSALAVLDIVPTATVFATTDHALATAYYHWFFLIQPDGLPERMIGADPRWWLGETLRRWAAPGFAFDPAALTAYEDAFDDPATIHAQCEDYRAAATIDLAHDVVDAGVPIGCPLLVLWGEQGAMHRIYDVLGAWTNEGTDVRGGAIASGHFLAEEAPEATARELLGLLSA